MVARLLTLALGLASSATALIANCGTGESLFKITDLALTPDVPVPGDVATMTIGFDAPMSVSAGDATFTLSLNGLPFSQKQSLCHATQCPIPAGHNVVTSNITIPTSVAGTVTAKIAWTDATGAELMCVRVKEVLTSKAVVIYDFVRPYTPYYLTAADYVEVLDSMHFFQDGFAPFEALNETAVMLVPVKKHLRGSSTTSNTTNTGTTTSTGTTGTNTTTTTGTTTGTGTTTNTDTTTTGTNTSTTTTYTRRRRLFA